MRSEVRFVMLPEVEAVLFRLITSDAGTVLVNGPRWGTPEPPIVARLEDAGPHLLIWSPSDHASLAANRHEKDGRVWWYCRDEGATIQFLRSRHRPGESFIYEGRLAVATTQRGEPPGSGVTASVVQSRYLSLKRQIQKSCRNKVVIWQNRSLPRSRTNPLMPDAGLWAGPEALCWLEEDSANRWVQVVPDAHARGYLLDMVP